MKAITILTGLAAAITLSSCGQFGVSSQSNPYGAPAAHPGNASTPYGNPSNPYGAPAPHGETGSYTPDTAPYQPIPGVPDQVPDLSGPANAGVGAGAAGATTSYTVVKGDSLWGIANRHGITVEALQEANGLTTTLIRVGETLQIPAQ